MADTAKAARARRIATVILPWLIGGGALLVYGLTLNHWVSLRSLPVVARVWGWDWQPQMERPLVSLLFFPFRFVAPAALPLALNLFTVGCAALVLMLLARSVALWPQDRTRPQWWREKSKFAILSTPTAWLPPLFAVLACGLQLTFWENATSATGEMIDLLIFAWIIRALLEFRVSQKQWWLSSVAFLGAVGMADNWVLLVYVPAFCAAVVWLKGFACLDLKFLTRMAMWALLGWLLYLVLPLQQSLSSPDQINFWAALKGEFRLQKNAWAFFSKGTLAALAFSVGVPFLAISVCWRGKNPNFGDDSLVGSRITKGIFHFVHAVFLFVSFWIMLDPPFSPRKIGYGIPFLTQYYISALVIGYCVGYFLLIGSIDVPKYVALPTLALIGISLVMVPAALIWRNLGQIRATNGPILRDFTRQLYEGLPRGKSFVLSDDATPLLLLRVELASSGTAKQPLPLDARALIFPQYQRYVARTFPSLWPYPAPTNGVEIVEPVVVLGMIEQLAAKMPGVYLQPSFNYFLERLQAQPRDAIVDLSPRAAGARASLDDSVFTGTEHYWQNLWTNSLNGLAANPAIKPVQGRGGALKVARLLQLAAEQNATVLFVNAAYSKSLNNWGVTAQRSGHWPEAGIWFQRAADLKPGNLSAHINLDFNQRHQRGNAQPLDRETVEKDYLNYFTRYRNWEAAVNGNGPLDEPTFLFETGRALLARGTSRQAALAFARCVELAPTWPEPNLWLAQTLVNEQNFAGAVRVTDAVQPANLPSDGGGLAQYLFCRATALQGLNQTNEAARCISEFVASHPEQKDILSIAARLYMQQMAYQPALGVLGQLLRHEPDKLEYLANKGLAEIQLSQYDQAIGTLTEALALAPNNQIVKLNRAIAGVRAGRLEPAWADYQDLLARSPNSAKVLFGLGEIAWRKHDTNAALGFYEQCSTNNLPDLADRRLVLQRLQQLKGAALN